MTWQSIKTNSSKIKSLHESCSGGFNLQHYCFETRNQSFQCFHQHNPKFFIDSSAYVTLRSFSPKAYLGFATSITDESKTCSILHCLVTCASKNLQSIEYIDILSQQYQIFFAGTSLSSMVKNHSEESVIILHFLITTPSTFNTCEVVSCNNTALKASN